MAASYGGIATYTRHLLAGWADRFPEDELHVVLPAGADWWPLPPGATRHDVRLAGPETLTRPLLMTAQLPRLVRHVRADAVLAVNPATTLRRLPVPLGVVVHDLRHELRPEQFPPARRAVRTVAYRWGLRVADVVIAVSQRTLDDVRARCGPRAAAKGVAVHEGADHVDGWARAEPNGSAIASCHHSNKDVGQLIDAWALLGDGADVPPLALLGLGGERADAARAQIAAAGLTGRVSVSPYLPDTEYEQLVTGARLVVFVSDFEGFGLPIVESMRLRIPVVIGPEPACLEVAGGHAAITAGDGPAALATAVRQALAMDDAQRAAAGQHADGFTWAATAAGVREALLGGRRGRVPH